MRSVALLLIVHSCLVTPGCPEAAITSADTPDATADLPSDPDARDWRHLVAGAPGPLHALWESPKGALWAVGASRDSTGALVLRRAPDEARWDRLATGFRGDLWTITSVATSAGERVYVAGDAGLLLSYDDETGGAFRHHPTNTLGNIYGLWAADSDEFWLVGGHEPGTVPAGSKAAVVFRSRFGVLEPTALPATLPASESLQAVWGTAPDRVFAVGDQGSLIVFDGVFWAHRAVPGNPRLMGVGGNSSSTWLVGGQATARVWRLAVDGELVDESPAGVPLLTSLHGPTADTELDDSPLAAAGILGTVRERRNGAWYDLPYPSTIRDWRSVRVSRQGDILVAGGHLLTQAEGGGTVLRYGPDRGDDMPAPWQVVDAVSADAPIYDVEDDEGPDVQDIGPDADTADHQQTQQGDFLVQIAAAVGGGGDTFSPFNPGAPLEIVQGFQGGIHLEIRVRVVVVGATAPAGRIFGDLSAKTFAGGAGVGAISVKDYPLEKVPGLADTFESPPIPVFFFTSQAAPYTGLTASLDVTFDHLGKSGQQTTTVLLIDSKP